jgi:hypothetical protein
MVFNANSGQTRWLSLEREYKEAEAILLSTSQESNVQITDAWKNRWGQLLNMNYTLSSYKKLKKLSGLVRKKGSTNKADDTPSEESDRINKDGTRVYHAKYADSSQADIDKTIPFFTTYTLEDFKYSERNMTLLAALLDYLQKRYAVEIFLTPYYPAVFQAMKVKVPQVVSVEDKIRDLASRRRIPVIGTYDPEAVKCTSADYYDGGHPKGTCIRKILEKAGGAS